MLLHSTRQPITHISTLRRGVQCQSHTATGARCSRWTSKGNQCAQHLRAENGLAIAPSTIAEAHNVARIRVIKGVISTRVVTTQVRVRSLSLLAARRSLLRSRGILLSPFLR